MGYPWECKDCDEYYANLVRNGKFYCKKLHMDVSPNERSCRTYFVQRDKNKPLNTKPNEPCYITTAIVNILGYEDDCYILENLRLFRDNYMKKKEECLPLLEDYNVVGPLISDKLREDNEKEKVSDILLNFYIHEALDAIEKEEYNHAIETYEDMTYSLMAYYDIDMNLLSNKKGMVKKRVLE